MFARAGDGLLPSFRLAIDLLSGGSFLREWVDDRAGAAADFEDRLVRDEQRWAEFRRPFLRY